MTNKSKKPFLVWRLADCTGFCFQNTIFWSPSMLDASGFALDPLHLPKDRTPEAHASDGRCTKDSESQVDWKISLPIRNRTRTTRESQPMSQYIYIYKLNIGQNHTDRPWLLQCWPVTMYFHWPHTKDQVAVCASDTTGWCWDGICTGPQMDLICCITWVTTRATITALAIQEDHLRWYWKGSVGVLKPYDKDQELEHTNVRTVMAFNKSIYLQGQLGITPNQTKSGKMKCNQASNVPRWHAFCQKLGQCKSRMTVLFNVPVELRPGIGNTLCIAEMAYIFSIPVGVVSESENFFVIWPVTSQLSHLESQRSTGQGLSGLF